MMKKRLLALLTACVMGLTLCGCMGGEESSAPFEVEGTGRALLDSGAYTDTEDMQPPLEPAVFFDRLDAGAVTGGAVYSSTYTAEVAAVILFKDETAAQDGEAVLKGWLSDRTAAERNYRPAEAEKLEKALLERRGSTVALVVAADADAAQTALDAWGK